MQFDPQSYLDLTTTQASERRPPVPIGDYIATVADLVPEEWHSKDKVDPTTGQLKSGIRFNISLELMLPEAVQEACKIAKLTLTDGVMVDRTAEGGIDYSPGKNGRLRQYRDATGLNVPGEPFSPRMLIGRTVRVKLTHEMYNGNVQERVGGLAKLG